MTSSRSRPRSVSTLISALVIPSIPQDHGQADERIRDVCLHPVPEPAEEREARVKDFVRRLRWKGPVFAISALAREGLDALIRAAYDHVAAQRHPHVEADIRFEEPPGV